MKKFTILALIGLLAVSSLNAKELLFDLRAQDFSNSQINKQIMTKYKVSDKVIVETNLNKSNSGPYYTHKYVKGIFNINLTTTVTDWKFNQDIIFDSDTNKYKRMIKIVDEFGENIILEFYKTGFTINGKEYKANIDEQKMIISINKSINNLTVVINKQETYTSTVKFNNLKSISVSIEQEPYDNWDKLNNLLLVSND